MTKAAAIHMIRSLLLACEIPCHYNGVDKPTRSTFRGATHGHLQAPAMASRCVAGVTQGDTPELGLVGAARCDRSDLVAHLVRDWQQVSRTVQRRRKAPEGGRVQSRGAPERVSGTQAVGWRPAA